jgi:hypothetical protein
MDNVQNVHSFINIPWPHTYRSYSLQFVDRISFLVHVSQYKSYSALYSVKIFVEDFCLVGYNAVTSQKTEVYITTVVTTSDPTIYLLLQTFRGESFVPPPPLLLIVKNDPISETLCSVFQ